MLYLGLIFGLITTPLINPPPVSKPTDYTAEIIQLEEAIKNQPQPEPQPEPKPTAEDCSCVLFAAKFIKLPPIKTPADLEDNSSLWEAEAVLLDYKLPHIAVIDKITNDGIHIKESNFIKCKQGKRVLRFNDPAIRGFYKPS